MFSDILDWILHLAGYYNSGKEMCVLEKEDIIIQGKQGEEESPQVTQVRFVIYHIKLIVRHPCKLILLSIGVPRPMCRREVQAIDVDMGDTMGISNWSQEWMNLSECCVIMLQSDLGEMSSCGAGSLKDVSLQRQRMSSGEDDPQTIKMV